MRRSESSPSISSAHDASSSISPAKPKRLGTLKGFLPLNETSATSAITARRQLLPHLLKTGVATRNSGIWYDEHEAKHLGQDREHDSDRSRDHRAECRTTAGFGRPDSMRSTSRRGSIEAEETHLEPGNPGSGMTAVNAMGGDARRLMSMGVREREGSVVLNSEQMRSLRLIGNSNPRYKWETYWRSADELKMMKKPLREYYERNNSLIQQYTFIDRLLDSSLPHDLIQEYQHAATPTMGHAQPDIPPTICEEPGETTSASTSSSSQMDGSTSPAGADANGSATPKVKRTPKNIYKIPESPPTSSEHTPLLKANSKCHDDPEDPEDLESGPSMPEWTPEEETDGSSRTVQTAIYVNLVANAILLVLKIIVVYLSSSVSVLAALVDAALDFLSTGIVFITTHIISRNSASDKEKYPVGRRRLEPLGVLVFSVIMITAFVQVAIEGFNRLTGGEHIAVQLTPSAIGIMASTVGVKGICWAYCKAIRNSSVEALAQDAMTDVVFNTFSIIFPLIGYYADIWWLDPLGGILLSCYVIFNWSSTSSVHIAQLTGAAASADQRNVLLYLTMRFAKTIKQIQGLNAYHVGDKLNVEVDVVLDEMTSLRDSHDVGEALQYVLESVPYVERAFVHLDYAGWNLPSHMEQQEY